MQIQGWKKHLNLENDMKAKQKTVEEQGAAWHFQEHDVNAC